MKKMILLLSIIMVVWATAQADELSDAITRGDFQTFKLLVAEKPELINKKDERGHTPLQYAAYSGQKDILLYLLENGASINEVDDFESNALHWAAYANQAVTAKLLIEKHIEKDKQNEDGLTPLHMAVTRGNMEVAELLLTQALNTSVRDKNKNSLAHLAVFNNRPLLVELLLRKGIDFNCENGTGDFPIHGVGWSGNKEIADMLIKAGIDINTKNSDGKTALNYAHSAGNKNMIAYLKNHGGESSASTSKKIYSTKKIHTSDKFKITILYDNYIFKENTKADWGFSCMVETPDGNIIFDTGTKPEILWHNIKETEMDVTIADKIVLSHIHYDHVGGLSSILEKKKNYQVFVPVSFPFDFIRKVEKQGSEVVAVTEAVKIMENVWLTGQMGDQIKEHSMILDTPKGLVVVTGCSHPGIVEIVIKAKEILNKEVYMVLGGFHLMRHDEEQTTTIAAELKKLGIKKCGASHCTGDEQIELIKTSFGGDFVKLGTGQVIEIDDKR